MSTSASPVAVEQFRTGTPSQEPLGIKRVEDVVDGYYSGLLSTVKCCLAVFAAMSLGERTKPLCVIFETPSGYGKTAALQMTFPIPGLGLEQFVYRSDKFTAEGFRQPRGKHTKSRANNSSDTRSNAEGLPSTFRAPSKSKAVWKEAAFACRY